jgi:hypothetical protein
VRIKIRISLQRDQCLLCGKRLGFLRRLTGSTVCCDEHEQEFLADLRALAITRLEGAAEKPLREESTVV